MRTVPGGHDFYEDSDGDVDEFYFEANYCNGPGCRDCGGVWCHHCTNSHFPGEIFDTLMQYPTTGVYAEKCPAIVEADPTPKEIT